MDNEKIFGELCRVEWSTAYRTFGNNHATLIGLLVHWWITRDIDNHSAIESGLSFNVSGTKGLGHRYNDALLCESDVPIGLVEVEGGGKRYVGTIEKLDKFLCEASEFGGLRFAIVLLYSQKPTGPKAKLAFPKAITDDALKAATEISRKNPSKDLFLIALEKEIEPDLIGLRKGRDLCCGRMSSVVARWYAGGELKADQVCFPP